MNHPLIPSFLQANYASKLWTNMQVLDQISVFCVLKKLCFKSCKHCCNAWILLSSWSHLCLLFLVFCTKNPFGLSFLMFKYIKKSVNSVIKMSLFMQKNNKVLFPRMTEGISNLWDSLNMFFFGQEMGQKKQRNLDLISPDEI